MTTLMDEAIRAGCKTGASDGKCDFPNCDCVRGPHMVKAAIAHVLTEAMNKASTSDNLANVVESAIDANKSTYAIAESVLGALKADLGIGG